MKVLRVTWNVFFEGVYKREVPPCVFSGVFTFANARVRHPPEWIFPQGPSSWGSLGKETHTETGRGTDSERAREVGQLPSSGSVQEGIPSPPEPRGQCFQTSEFKALFSLHLLSRKAQGGWE